MLRHCVETGAVVKVQGTLTAVDQAGAKSAVTGPWANQEDLLKDVSAAEISRLLGVSRNTVYRYLGPGWKRRTKAEAHQPAAGVADAAGHDLTDQPARLRPGTLKPVGGADFGDSAPAHRGFPGEHPVPGANAGEPVTSRGKRALSAGRSIPRETPVLQIRHRSALTLDETIPGPHHFRIH